MKKVLFLHPNLNVGGAEVMRLKLLTNIDRRRYDIKICCIGEKGVLGRKIEELGYKVDELKQNPNSLSAFITYKVIKYLKKQKPDILHSSLFNANFHGRVASLFCRIPHVITEEHGEHKQYKGMKFFPYVLSDFFLSRLNSFIVCCSESLRGDIIKKEKLPKEKVVSIANCLDRSMYKVKFQKEEIRKRYKISDEIVFICVAALKAGKGHEDLLASLKEIREAGCRFRCFLVGEGFLRSALEKKCREFNLSDEVIFLGNVDNITDYLNASDVFVLPSLSEGLSIALMEAMFMGLACITTDVGSNPDLIKNRSNGILISPGDKKALRDALIFYFQNKGLIREFGAKSRSIIETRYSSINEYARGYYELWDRCIKNKG